jgi:hypothetical protein
MRIRVLAAAVTFLAVAASAESPLKVDSLPENKWVEVRRDAAGARPGSAVRYAPDAGAFFLWGFMNADPDLLQELPVMEVPEYDIVAFDPADGQWRSQLPKAWEAAWKQKLPLAYVPRTYAGLTTGSERIVLRSPTSEAEGAPRPDLNIVFDQVEYHPGTQSLIYFTGGLTASYRIRDRRWVDLSPVHTPPPVLGGSLAYNPVHDEMILFGGGHVAEPDGSGRLVGYTGTWAYRFRERDWTPVRSAVQPPPRMNARMVLDSRNGLLVVFGGDAQSHYLGDTWLFDLRTREWRKSKSQSGPDPRAGHFSVYDPESGLIVVGGGYNRQDLRDMWSYDAASDRWQRVEGEAPTGFYLSADLSPRDRLIVMVTSSQAPGDTMSCNILHPVRTTYAYRIGKLIPAAATSSGSTAIVEKRPAATAAPVAAPQPLDRLMPNRWVRLGDGGPAAPTRTWGSATFDTDRGRILYWGGEHCGYEGNDVDAYDVAAQAWRPPTSAESPERLWNHAVRLAGVTFNGRPWTVHGRKMYAYDQVSRKLILIRPIRLTTGYEPQQLKGFPLTRVTGYADSADALVVPPSSIAKNATWTYEPVSGAWELLGPAPAGVDTLVTTRHGVIGVGVDWPSRLNDAGYQLPWDPADPPKENSVYVLDVSRKDWKRLSTGQPAPQNLYEQTSLVYDDARDQVLLHGAGLRRDELWAFQIRNGRWKKLDPRMPAQGEAPPVCSREAVVLPGQNLMVTYSDSKEPELWIYDIQANAWQHGEVGYDEARSQFSGRNQNRGMVYDPIRNLILQVLGTSGDEGQATVYALKFGVGPR